MKVLKNNIVVLNNIKIADTYFKRLKGLMFTKRLQEDEGLYITPCKQIHMFFMSYSLDVVYLDKDNIIIATEENLRPNKIGKYIKGSLGVIELPFGKIKEVKLRVGDALEFVETIR